MSYPVIPEGFHLTNRDLGMLIGGMRLDQFHEVFAGIAARINLDTRRSHTKGPEALAAELDGFEADMTSSLAHLTRMQAICGSYLAHDIERNRPAPFTVIRDDAL